MVATFLAGELGSERFGATLAGALDGAGAGRALVEAPNVADAAANALRRRLLAETRGYGSGEGLFAGFPDDVSWDVVALRPEELAAVRYIDYDYWVELSGGTRAPADAARRIVAGIDVFGVSSRGFLDAAAAYVPADATELIVVTAGAGHPVVVLEGHVRLTVYALRPALVPSELQVLLGTSAGITAWALY